MIQIDEFIDLGFDVWSQDEDIWKLTIPDGPQGLFLYYMPKHKHLNIAIISEASRNWLVRGIFISNIQEVKFLLSRLAWLDPFLGFLKLN